jgi:predicted CopG family antitoxin
MSQEYSTISVSKETRKRLMILKAELGYRSYDDLIRDLLRRAGYADQ